MISLKRVQHVNSNHFKNVATLSAYCLEFNKSACTTFFFLFILCFTLYVPHLDGLPFTGPPLTVLSSRWRYCTKNVPQLCAGNAGAPFTNLLRLSDVKSGLAVISPSTYYWDWPHPFGFVKDVGGKKTSHCHPKTSLRKKPIHYKAPHSSLELPTLCI